MKDHNQFTNVPLDLLSIEAEARRLRAIYLARGLKALRLKIAAYFAAAPLPQSQH